MGNSPKKSTEGQQVAIQGLRILEALPKGLSVVENKRVLWPVLSAYYASDILHFSKTSSGYELSAEVNLAYNGMKFATVEKAIDFISKFTIDTVTICKLDNPENPRYYTELYNSQ